MLATSINVQTLLTALLAALIGVAPGGAAPAAGPPGPSAAPAAHWRPVADAFRQATERYDSSATSLTVWRLADPTHPVTFQAAVGAAVDREIPVASASKLAASVLVLQQIREGTLAMNTTVGQFPQLGATGATRAITVRDLLSQTSGLQDNTCAYLPFTTLTDCARSIVTTGLRAGHARGKQFSYNNGHLHVLGAMTVLAYNRKHRSSVDWNTLWDAKVADPSGISRSAQWYANPLGALGPENPLIAGGLVISPTDYGKLLHVVATGRTRSGRRLIDAAALQAQTQQWRPNVDPTRTYSPLEPRWDYDHPGSTGYNYGLGTWRECPMPAPGTTPADSSCSVISSAGAFGFVPWVDRANGYYAVLATYDLRDVLTLLDPDNTPAQPGASLLERARCAPAEGAGARPERQLQAHCKGVSIEQAVQPAVRTVLRQLRRR